MHSINMKISAQGTIEYLIIIAVVVVVSLILVGLLTGFLSSGSQVDEKQSQIYWKTQPLAIIESQTDSEGNILVVLKNNTSENQIINSITINGVTAYFDSFSLVMGEKKTVYLNNPSIEASISNQVNISYTTPQGITKTQTGSTDLVAEQTTTINPNDSVVMLNEEDCFNWGPGTHTICSCDDLNNIDFNSTTRGRNYILQNNLDFRNCDSSYSTGEGWKPIGTSAARFLGKFNGNNKTIKNLYINRPTTDFVGLIGFANNYSQDVNDLGMIDSNITGQNDVGGIVGYNGTVSNSYNTGTVNGYGNSTGGINGAYGIVNNSYNVGTVNGTSRVGGINGQAGTVNNSYNTGTVNATTQIGGISGYIGTVNDSYNTGTINGTDRTGGISGHNGNVNNSYNAGTINGTGNYTGGISGYSGTINSSYNTGTINGTGLKTGGIIGYIGTVNNSYNTGTINGSNNETGGINGSSGTVNNSYNLGTINGIQIVGGISGGYGVVNNSYNTGTVNGVWSTGGINGYRGTVNNSYNTGTINGTGTYTGGINGYYGTVNNSYNLGRVSGTSNVGGVMGQLTSENTIYNSFSTSTVIGNSNVRGTVGYITSGTVVNVYWYDSNVLDSATGCYHGGDANCTYLDDTNYSQLYILTTDVYDTVPVWDANWVWSGSAYPTLSWE